MKSRRDEWQNIVEKAELPAEWKEMLKEVFSRLSERNEKVWDKIEETVLREEQNSRSAWHERWHLATVLVPEEKTRDAGSFHRVIDRWEEENDEEDVLGEALPMDIEGIYFLNCPYAEVDSLCVHAQDNTYPYEGHTSVQGKDVSFHYRLVPYRRFITREEELFHMAEIYGIMVPILFSPYARRAVKIQLSEEDRALAEQLQGAGTEPYCFEENHLADKILSDAVLLWNIAREQLPPPCHSVEEENHSFVAPYGERNVYRYVFSGVKDREFICPAQTELSYLISADKDTEKEQITLLTKRKLSEDCISMRLIGDVDRLERYGMEAWSNMVFFNIDRHTVIEGGNVFSKERLRTQGDLNRVLCALQMPAQGLSCKLNAVCPAREKDIKPICRYKDDFAYGASAVHREQQLYKRNRHLPYVYLSFSGDAKFLNDYANFVLSFLEKRYPDFQWVGVQ